MYLYCIYLALRCNENILKAQDGFGFSSNTLHKQHIILQTTSWKGVLKRNKIPSRCDEMTSADFTKLVQNYSQSPTRFIKSVSSASSILLSGPSNFLGTYVINRVVPLKFIDIHASIRDSVLVVEPMMNFTLGRRTVQGRLQWLDCNI